MDDLELLTRRFMDEFQSQGDETVDDELLADTYTPHRPGMSPDWRCWRCSLS